jgi:hypothetical protein
MQTKTEARKVSAQRLVSYQPEMQSAEAFRLKLAQWFLEATQCRFDISLAEDLAANRDRQRGMLTSLIAYGEWAQMQTRKEKLDLSPIGVTLEDVAAETRILRDTYRLASRTH